MAVIDWYEFSLCNKLEIAIKNMYRRIAVIAGVGVRNYYRKLGYELKSSYMIKKLQMNVH